MKSAPIPANDGLRVQALRDILILDTAPEERFDRITQFAAREFDVPVALLSLVDDNRQWCKSSAGLAACESARDISFCGYTILTSGIFVVEDALLDERFADNPLVVGAPFIRFYAGSPLLLPSGFAIGTFCIMDTRPRHLDAIDLKILETLQGLAAEELANQNPALRALAEESVGETP